MSYLRKQLKVKTYLLAVTNFLMRAILFLSIDNFSSCMISSAILALLKHLYASPNAPKALS